MKKPLVNLLSITLFLGFSNLAMADLQSDIIGCSATENTTDRLDCYDTVAKYYKTRPQAAKSSDTIANDVPTPVPTAAVNPITPSPSSNAKIPQISASEAFGQADSVGLQSIQSRIVGDFTGWDKGLRLTLENGQVWKVTSRKSGYKKMKNPAVTISRGVLGSFDATVEGLNAKAKVRRVK